VPGPQDRATFLRSKLDWAEPEREGHRELLGWYRELTALRRARPELTDPRLHRIHASYDEDGRWLVVRRGALAIAANLGPAQRELPLGAPAAAVLVESGSGTVLAGEVAVLPGTSFAVIETVTGGRPSDAAAPR
jgi:maltooligosyltrehalose trehalohydrolase